MGVFFSFSKYACGKRRGPLFGSSTIGGSPECIGSDPDSDAGLGWFGRRGVLASGCSRDGVAANSAIDIAFQLSPTARLGIFFRLLGPGRQILEAPGLHEWVAKRA